MNPKRLLRWLKDYSVSLSWTLAFLALIANATIFYWNFMSVTKSFDDVADRYETRHRLQQLKEIMLNAETGQRGFLITKDEKYLEPYYLALSNIDATMKSIQDHFTDKPDMLAKLTKLREMMDRKLEEMKAIIVIRREQNFEAAAKRVSLNYGKVYMDAFRDGIQAITSEEEAKLKLHRDGVEMNRQRGFITFIAGNVVLTLMVLAAFLLVRQQLQVRHLLTSQLRQVNEELEQRVEHRTQALRATNESLGIEIQERTRLEEQAVKYAEELKRSNKELEQFASVASHDLQEPLRKIQAFSDRLHSRYVHQLDDNGREYLDRIQSSASRMRRLIEDLLAFSRVGTRGKPFVPVDLQQVAQGVLADLEERLTNTGGHIELDTLPSIVADELQMRQLLLNLLANALKFQRPGVPPVVHVTSRLVPPIDPESPEMLEIIVRDEGIGFEQQYAERIFQLFQRLHGRNEYDGTGMGLAICRKIAERHGGSIAAQGVPGEGATFTVLLPVTHSDISRM